MNNDLLKNYDDKQIIITASQLSARDPDMGIAITKPANLNLQDFEYDIARMNNSVPYHYGDKSLKNELENNTIPVLVYPVYVFLVENERFPTLQEATLAYINMYCDKIGQSEYRFKEKYHVEGNPRFFYSDILGRMYRSYYSFVREIQLLLALSEYDDIEVKYDFRLDLEGADIICTNPTTGKIAYIASYVYTPRSMSWKYRKDNFKHDHPFDCYIDAIAYMGDYRSNTMKVGAAAVYTPKYVSELHAQIIALTSIEEARA